MADLTTLARPYAKAAFEAALEGNDLDNWSQMLSVTATVSSIQTVGAVLTSPTLAAEARARTLIDLCGDELDQKGRNFITILAENRRLALLPEIATIYETLKANQQKSVDVEITTAFDVSPEASERLAEALKKRLQRDIRLSSKVDRSLIGGALIKAGDTVIDNSIRGKLTKLAEAMNS
jgi:F-type H+-transporting ATPase subunit delta